MTSIADMRQGGERIYLDYGATAPMDPRVLEAMMPFFTQDFGNASSLYTEGKVAQQSLEQARRQVARLVGVRDPHEIVFTSGGTESDNMAIAGIALAARAKMSKSLGCGHVVCSSFEHKAVLNSVDHLKSFGFEVSTVRPGPDGIVRPEDLEAALRPDTVLVSIMLANNEIGTVQPIAQLAQVAHAHGVAFHTDAVAAMGKMPVDIAALGVDALSFTAHKLSGPVGIGALYLSKRRPCWSLVQGGGQEKNRRSGTSNVAGAVGFAAAMQLACGDEQPDEMQRCMQMRDWLVQQVNATTLPIQMVCDIPEGDAATHLPHVVPFAMKGMQSEDLVMRLDARGFAVSGGSACTSGSATISHVLSSIGYDAAWAQGFLRVSMGRTTSQHQIEMFWNALCDIVETRG